MAKVIEPKEETPKIKIQPLPEEWTEKSNGLMYFAEIVPDQEIVYTLRK